MTGRQVDSVGRVNLAEVLSDEKLKPSLLFYMSRAWRITLGSTLVVATILIRPLDAFWFGNVMVGFVAFNGWTLLVYYAKISGLKIPQHESSKIPAISIGAVAALQGFFGVIAAISMSLLLDFSKQSAILSVVMAWMFAAGAWSFLVLSIRFHEACYFYNVWDRRRINRYDGPGIEDALEQLK